MATLNLTIDKGSTFERTFAIKGATINDLVDITSGSPTISGILRTDILSTGMSVVGTGIPLGATISTIVDTHTITISANATETAVDRAVTFRDSSYVDLTGYEFRSQIRTTVEAPTVAANFTFVKNVDNTVNMSLTSTDTSLLVGNSFVYDVEMYTALDAYVVKIFSGSIIANEEVTR